MIDGEKRAMGVSLDYGASAHQGDDMRDAIPPFAPEHDSNGGDGDGTDAKSHAMPETRDVIVTEGGFTRTDIIGNGGSRASRCVEVEILMGSDRRITLRGDTADVLMALGRVTARPSGFIRMPADLMPSRCPTVINRAEIVSIDIKR